LPLRLSFHSFELECTNFFSQSPAELGPLHQFGIFYALCTGLLCQGIFSICYHACPTRRSLQFDTTIMYIIGTLALIKVYQVWMGCEVRKFLATKKVCFRVSSGLTRLVGQDQKFRTNNQRAILNLTPGPRGELHP
jgi:hypothetical protein